MPFARVGAMPPPSRFDEQSSSSDDQNGGRSGRSSRQKGITMEDLKKQTAMRLALEQQHGSTALSGAPAGVAAGSSSNDSRTKRPVVTPQSLAARRNASAVATTGYATAPAVPREAAHSHYQRLHHHHNPPPPPPPPPPPSVVHHIPNNSADPYTTATPPPHYYDHSQGSRNLRHGKVKPKPGVAPHAAHSAPHSTGRYHHAPDSRSQYTRSASAPVVPVNPLSSTASAYNTAASNQGGQQGSSNNSNSSSKLPHGLTVHELKEMTKARLQAEAAEKMPTGGSSGPNFPSSCNVVELETRETSAFNGVTSIQQQQRQSNNHNNMYSLQPNSFQQHYDDGQSMHLDPTSIRPAQVSPPSPAMHGFLPAGHGYGNENNNNNTLAGHLSAGNRARVDSYPESNWESASVTSHNSTASYLGSESAFSAGVGGGNGAGFSQGGDDQSLGRTQSYPAGFNRSVSCNQDMPSRENTPTSVPSPLGSSYFDSAGSLGQNRQRAMTLSPRPGLSLLHEDRPGFSEEDLAIPSFSSSRHVRQPLPNRSRRSFSPIMQPQPFGIETMAAYGGGSSAAGVIGGGLHENRPRTSSAVSLPAISHTAEEFALDPNMDGGASSRRSSDSVGIRSFPIQEHEANSLITGTPGFLGSASLYGDSDPGTHTSSASGVFRNEFSGMPPPPGLEHPSVLSLPRMDHLSSVSSGNTDSIGSNRVRASTWDVFGSSTSAASLHQYTVAEDTLAGDLASILKLSGAEEKVDGERPPGMFGDFSGFGKSNDFGGNLY